LNKLKPTFFFLVLSVSIVSWGCRKADSAPVDKTVLFVPSTFTPNGDHRNDTFGIQSAVPLTYFHIKIYDNTNILIFETNDFHNCWDGSYHGSPEPIGSYLWYIEFEADGIPKSSQTGYVELLR
jgi:gliding motility-associated-like protein